MSDGQILKPEKDFTKEADKQIPEAEELAKVINVAGYNDKVVLINWSRAIFKAL